MFGISEKQAELIADERISKRRVRVVKWDSWGAKFVSVEPASKPARVSNYLGYVRMTVSGQGTPEEYETTVEDVLTKILMALKSLGVEVEITKPSTTPASFSLVGPKPKEKPTRKK